MSNFIETAIVIANFGIYDIAFAKAILQLKLFLRKFFNYCYIGIANAILKLLIVQPHF